MRLLDRPKVKSLPKDLRAAAEELYYQKFPLFEQEYDFQREGTNTYNGAPYEYHAGNQAQALRQNAVTPNILVTIAPIHRGRLDPTDYRTMRYVRPDYRAVNDIGQWHSVQNEMVENQQKLQNGWNLLFEVRTQPHIDADPRLNREVIDYDLK